MNTTWWMRMPVAVAIALAVAACASIGRPQGGPKDETPPEYVRSNPAPGTTNFRRQQINITFNENIKVEDVINKVVIAPAQQIQPSIVANGRHLNITLKDTLIPDVTYTLDFSDAIRDLNEGNILDGFAIDFATGDSIDSLRISGMVLEAATLEPAQGIIVGAYRNVADSAISTLRFERITKTNQSGQFTLRNLKHEPYRLFALNDLNRDFHWDRSEDVAFYNAPVTPWAETIEVTDTFVAADGTDSIVTRQGTSYFPNDILLTWFNENYQAQYLRDYSRPERNKINIGFAAPSDTFPILTVTNGENAGRIINEAARLEYTANRDTLCFWIEDSALIKQDSLLVATQYLRTDSTDALAWTTDTLRFIFKLSAAQKREIEKAEKAKADKEKRRRERIEKALQSGDSALLADTMPEKEKITYLDVKAVSGSQQEYNRPLKIHINQPLSSIRKEAISLQWLEDSTWVPFDETIELTPDTAGNIMDYTLDVRWDYGTKYKLQIDSAAMTGIYGLVNDKFNHEFEVKSSEDYSTLIFNIPTLPYLPEPPYNWSGTEKVEEITDSAAVETPSDSIVPRIVVQLLSSGDAPVASAVVTDGKARFDFIAPDTYYARAFIDVNGNGLWDTGKLLQWQQPEDIYYYPKKINVKKNWDLEQTWDLLETPLDKQKPYDILKNKPKTSENDKRRTDDDEEEEENEYGGNNLIYGQGATT
ncbi:MAG: Ig-like domain-containing protein, partial [Muribaculaceae bacterium]|nr:Ig-like domain-containing protein [Muribaculaceae bacterium]